MMENCPLLLTTDSAVSQSDSASLSHAKNCVLNFEERKAKREKIKELNAFQVSFQRW